MLRKFAATTSTAALAIGMLAAGAGVAAAEDEAPSNGSMSSDSLGLDLEKTATDLELANQALNGPVDVTPNAEGGPTVSFTNETEDTLQCVGFTMPYTTVDENDINPGEIDLSDLLGALALLETIEDGGGVSTLDVDADGKPVSNAVTPGGAQLATMALTLLGEEQGGVAVDPGKNIEWTAASPEEPSAATVLCAPEGATDLSTLELKFGVDKQVVADQINSKIPGGSIEPVGPGSISGGSVELGANALGSLAGGDNEAEEPTDPAE